MPVVLEGRQDGRLPYNQGPYRQISRPLIAPEFKAPKAIAVRERRGPMHATRKPRNRKERTRNLPSFHNCCYEKSRTASAKSQVRCEGEFG